MNQLVKAPDAILVDKYDCAGPRYTSYPTAPRFSEDFDVERYRGDLAQVTSAAGLSLYVHVPFCRDICYYCACNKVVTRDPQAARRYLDHLQREIVLQSALHGSHRPIRQLHWGGGTPTFLDNAEITELWHLLASHFKLLDRGRREYAIEIDPRTVEEDTIALLKGIGFNRISLGVQDFDPLVQQSINRVQPFHSVARLVDTIRRYDFQSLSFDLIYGLPNQDRLTMQTTLARVLQLRPERIACYNYAHLPERFSSQRAIDRMSLPTVTNRLAMQELIAETLQAGGYRHIGLDHYVLPGDELAQAQDNGRLQRNFQGYSVQLAEDLLGLGVSAISQVGDYYVQNARDLPAYYRSLTDNRLPIARGYRINGEDKLRRAVIMALICNLELDLADCERQHGIDFYAHFASLMPALRDMADDGLLSLRKDCVRVTPAGRPFLRNICMLFDQYLSPEPLVADAPRYSATL